MTRPSVLERLQQVQPNAELWWDSSPLVYDRWRAGMINRSANRDEMTAWLDRLFSAANPPEANLFRGVTTNPSLTFNAVKDDFEHWSAWIDERIRSGPSDGLEAVYWDTYKEVARRGAEIYRPQFEASGRIHGFVSAQADPRLRHNAEAMVAQGMELHALAPNVMIKVPGTAEGYEAIRRLTAVGVPTNNTVSLVMAQFVACMEAVTRGLRAARAAGIDLSGWRSVITIMSARFGTLGALQQEAEDLGLDLSESDIRWAEVALMKRACRLIDANPDYPGKLLLSSMRVSPVVDGYTHVWHLEKIAGADIVYTLPPSFLERLLVQAPDLEFSDQWAEPVPAAVMAKLLRIPYFERGYREDGYTAAEFTTHPAFQSTAREFSLAARQMVELIAERMSALRRS
jgi:transaldolase